MTHYLLNYLDVRFIFAKSCAKRIAKNVATEMRDDNGFSVFFLNFLLFLFVAQPNRRGAILQILILTCFQ